MSNSSKEFFVVIAICILFLGGISMGINIGDQCAVERFEKAAIAAGVGYYNPTNKKFVFGTNNFQEINR